MAMRRRGLFLTANQLWPKGPRSDVRALPAFGQIELNIGGFIPRLLKEIQGLFYWVCSAFARAGNGMDVKVTR